MFPFTNPTNGNPFQNAFGNQTGPNQAQSAPNGGQNPFGDWGNLFQQGFPFSSDQLQQHINNTIANSVPDFLKNMNMQPANTNTNTSSPSEPAPANVEVFETHDFVVARIPVVDEETKPKLSLDTYRLYIKGLPGDPKNQVVVPLPAPIKPKYTKAEFKSGVLEVRMLKKGPEPMTDITIEG